MPRLETARAHDPTVVVLLLLALIGVCRLWLAAELPLMDTTEARFAGMARRMVETGDWIVPQHDYGVPYLAKPPLAFWLAAAGIAVSGAGELGPRVPILATGLVFSFLFFGWLRRELGAQAALAATAVLSSSALFFVSLGAVMTDLVLTVATVTAVLAFWSRYSGGSATAELALYVALGAGLLAKGPLALVLSLGPIALWALVTRNVGTVWQRFSWGRGALLALAIALPWYLAAEWRNPGFLRYFIVGEHLQRFLIPGWSGDLYGRAHDVPRGTIGLFFALAALPWSLLLVPALVRARTVLRRHWRERRELALLALFAALVPLGLFTLSRNVIVTYALPALPPAVLAAFVLLAPAETQPGTFRGVVAIAVVTVLLATAAGALLRPEAAAHSQRDIVSAIQARRPALDWPVHYWRKREFSADYYGGRAFGAVADAGPLAAALAAHERFYVVIEARRLGELPAEVAAGLVPVEARGAWLVLEPRYAASRDGKAS